MNVLAVFIGGGLGSILRYGISVGSKKIFTSEFPIGTLISNLIACLVLAMVVGLFANKMTDTTIKLLVATGFCGGFSTFSTFGMETVNLMRDGHTGLAIANVGISVLAAVAIFYFLTKST